MKYFTELFLDEMIIMSLMVLLVSYVIFSFLCFISNSILDWIERHNMQERLEHAKKKRDRKRLAQQKISLAGD